MNTTHKIQSKDAVKLIRQLDEFRKLDSSMPVGEIIFLLHCSLLSEPSMKVVAQYADIPESSASRYMTHLAAGRPAIGKPGVNLLSTYENPLDRKMKIIQITPKGGEFLQTLFKV